MSGGSAARALGIGPALIPEPAQVEIGLVRLEDVEPSTWRERHLTKAGPIGQIVEVNAHELKALAQLLCGSDHLVQVHRARVHLADTQPEAFRDMSGLDEYPKPRKDR